MLHLLGKCISHLEDLHLSPKELKSEADATKVQFGFRALNLAPSEIVLMGWALG